jgi:hypothetical protein
MKYGAQHGGTMVMVVGNVVVAPQKSMVDGDECDGGGHGGW